MTAPLITVDGDTPRARRSDPEGSHVAADLSSLRRKKVMLAVLEMVRDDGAYTGVEINADYPSWSVVGGPYFPRCAPDTPRKRLEDAEREGWVKIVGHGPRREATYDITDEGLTLLKRLGR